MSESVRCSYVDLKFLELMDCFQMLVADPADATKVCLVREALGLPAQPYAPSRYCNDHNRIKMTHMEYLNYQGWPKCLII